MDNNESAIIKPPYVFNFDLILKIVPSVRIGERVVSLVGIEEVSYQEIEITDPIKRDPAKGNTEVQLAVSYASGCVYYFDDEEEQELEEQIKLVIKKGEVQQAFLKQEQQEMMTQAAQEAYRRELQQVQVPNLKAASPFVKFRK